MPHCEVEAGKIYYETHGKGEVLVLLRGLSRSSSYWLGFEKVLAKNFKVVLIDARGLGRSDAAMSWNDGLPALAQDCLAVLDKLRIKRFHIFGLSLGGMVALELAGLAPERIQGLIVANSSSADYHGIRFDLMSLWLLFFALFQGNFHQALLRRTVSAPTVRSRGPEILEQWHSIALAEGWPLVTTLKQLYAASRFTIKGRIDVQAIPTLVLVSGGDRLVPRANSLKLHRLLKGSQYKVLKGAGHEINLGHERDVARIITQFFKSSPKTKA